MRTIRNDTQRSDDESIGEFLRIRREVRLGERHEWLFFLILWNDGRYVACVSVFRLFYLVCSSGQWTCQKNTERSIYEDRLYLKMVDHRYRVYDYIEYTKYIPFPASLLSFFRLITSLFLFLLDTLSRILFGQEFFLHILRILKLDVVIF